MTFSTAACLLLALVILLGLGVDTLLQMRRRWRDARRKP